LKILSDYPKFGIMNIKNQNEQVEWYTEKNFCPNCNIEYPEFTTQHFSPNRQE
jgi:excinuclease UvrABC ATPase subunit